MPLRSAPAPPWRATAERKVAAAAVPDPDPVDDDSAASHTASHVFDQDRGTVHDAMLLHKAATLLNLHAQAVAVNIRSIIHTTLNVNSGSYARWREQFLLVVGKYSLQDHVLSNAPAPSIPDWVRMDYIVRSWIVDSISNDLANAVLERDSTARSA